MLRFRKSKLVILAICLCCLGIYLFWKTIVRRSGKDGTKCNREETKHFLEEICEDYLDGRIGGTFCSQLCPLHYSFNSFWCPSGRWDEKERVIHVFVRNANRHTVLKSARKRTFGNTAILSRALLVINEVFTEDTEQDERINLLRDTASAVLFGNRSLTPASSRDHMVRECDYNSNGKVDLLEVRKCFSIVTSKEYLMGVLLDMLPVAPQILGTCGPVYAMERVDAEWWGWSLTWKRRAELALSFLDLVEVLESMPFEVAYICDARNRNFGVRDGRTVIIVDLDSVFFEGELEAEMQNQVSNGARCRSDRDCDDLVSCTTRCNRSTELCEATLLSSNLDVVCREIFRARSLFQPGLLDSPPDERLSQLLADSCNPTRNAVRKSSTLVLSEPELMKDVKSALQAFIDHSS